jgi:hypothetical protein
MRWLALLIICAVGSFTAYVDRNVVPLLMVLFAVMFLTAMLVKEIQASKRVFLGRLIVAALVVIVGISAFNYVVNPFGLYPPHVFEPLALTTRDYKMNLYAAYSPPPRAVVMGSSRSFTVNPNQISALWGYRAFNASLTGGSMQDFLAFSRYMAQAGTFPDLLIINLAPEIFQWTDNNRYQLEPDSHLWNYADFNDPLFPLKDGFYRMTRLLSQEQLDASVRVLWARQTDRAHLDGYIIDPNGMAYFIGTHLSADDLNPDKLFYNTWGTRFVAYQPDALRLETFQKILEIAKQHNTLVIGYMPPYHPALRDMMESRTQFTANLAFITGQLDSFEKEYRFHYMNFIDSDTFSNGDAMFYDSNHPSIPASAVILRQLYQQFHRYSQTS